MKNEQIVFNKVPDGMPQDDTFKYEETDVTEPENEVQLETLYIRRSLYERSYDKRRLIREPFKKANRSMVTSYLKCLNPMQKATVKVTL